MRMWMAIAVMMFAAVGHASTAEAGFYSGSRLLEECESASLADGYGCTGYLGGISDITETYDAWGNMNKGFCIPEAVTFGQLKKVVIKGLNEVPEELHLNAASTVANIFYEAFPCD